MKAVLAQMERHFYVRVSHSDENGTVSYDVGPFSTGSHPTISKSAISWIYQQIGLIKLKFPQAELVKHGWDYTEIKGKELFSDVYSRITDLDINIKIEIAGYEFTMFVLYGPEGVTVVEQQLCPTPEKQIEIEDDFDYEGITY